MARYLRAPAAVLICLALVGLPDAVLYTSASLAPILVAVTLVLAAVTGWWAGTARERDPEATPPSPGEITYLFASGAILTGLFWTRAHLDVPTSILSDLPLHLTAALGGWAWPALLLVVLYRGGREGLRPHGRRRFGVLLLWGVGAGTLGYVAHLPLVEAIQERSSPRATAGPAELPRALTRPTEAPWAVGLAGGPWTLTTQRPRILFLRSDPFRMRPVGVDVEGEVVPGLRRDLSWWSQGTELTSSDPAVVEPRVDHSGRWVLQPGGSGGAVVTVSNRRVQTWIGVWVLEDGRHAPAPEDVTHLLAVEFGPARPGEEGFVLRQELILRNVSDVPVLGPIHAVFHPSDAHLGLMGSGSTRHPVAFGLPGGASVPEGVRAPRLEIFPDPDYRPVGPPWTPLQVLGPGEAAAVEIPVVHPLDPETDRFHVRLVRSLRPF